MGLSFRDLFAKKERDHSPLDQRLAAQLSFEHSKYDESLLLKGLSNSSEKSEDILNRLQANLRYTAGLNWESEVRLEEELQYLSDYLLLEQDCRTEDPLYYSIKTDIQGDVVIPALVFKPFIQNACIHGLNSIAKYPIRIQIKSNPASGLNFSISNRVNHYVEDQSANEWMDLAKARLAYHFPKSHQLIINSNSNIFKVSLYLDHLKVFQG